MLQVTIYLNIGVERRRTAIATGLYDYFCHILFFLHSFSLHLFVSKSLNDEERGGNCLLLPERSYGPARGRGPSAPRFTGPPIPARTLQYDKQRSNFTWWSKYMWGSIYRVDHAHVLANIFATRMLTCDLFAVADLHVTYSLTSSANNCTLTPYWACTEIGSLLLSPFVQKVQTLKNNNNTTIQTLTKCRKRTKCKKKKWEKTTRSVL